MADDITALFPAPWRLVRVRGSGHYVVKDREGRKLAYVYRRDHSWQYEMLTDDEAEAMAKAIARLSRPKE